jgi:lauroyl/myristoyl acyltransferase
MIIGNLQRAMSRLATDFEYRAVLPLMAHLPLSWSYRLSDLRGALNARLGRDWVELALNQRYVGERSAEAFREFVVGASEEKIKTLVTERYQTVAREELDGALTIAGRLGEIEVDTAPIQAALTKRGLGRGLVVLLPHHDSFFVAMLALGRCGVTAHLMISDVVFDARVPPAIRAFTKKKYEAYQQNLNGGRFLGPSAHSREFFSSQLLAGNVLMVVTDTPASKNVNSGTWVSWLGSRRKMADGAVRIALETGSQLMAMHARHEAPGRQRWTCSELVDPLDCGPQDAVALRERTLAPLANFLEQVVLKDPGRWSASHLLGDFECEES